MPASDPSWSAWRERTPSALLVTGVVLIVASLLVPKWLSSDSPAWSPEQARRLQQASARLHHLTHQHGEEISGPDAHQPPAEFKEAEAEFNELSGQLDAARNQPARLSAVLRVLGIALAVAGAIMHLAVTRAW